MVHSSFHKPGHHCTDVKCTNWLILAEHAKVQEERNELKKELFSVQEELRENIEGPGLAALENKTVS